MTNITEFLGREMLAALPILCGYPAGGSDYECFSAFCRSAAKVPDSADVQRVRRILCRCFACDLPPDGAHCDEIWHRTADVLLSGGSVLPPVPEDLYLPAGAPELPVYAGALTDCPPLQGAKTWQKWVARSEAALTGAEAVRVRLPSGFRALNPGLWHAERILRGEETDASLAAAQQVIFLSGVCRAECRLCIVSDCPPQEVLHMLRIAARRHALPPLIWSWSPDAAPGRDALLCAAKLVCAPAGVPPILTSRTV